MPTQSVRLRQHRRGTPRDLDVINKERSLLGKQPILHKAKLPEDYNFDARERTLCIEESLNTHQTMPHMYDVVHYKIGAFALSLEVLV